MHKWCLSFNVIEKHNPNPERFYLPGGSYEIVLDLIREILLDSALIFIRARPGDLAFSGANGTTCVID